MPGVFLVSDRMPLGQAIDAILLAVECPTPEECRDVVRFVRCDSTDHCQRSHRTLDSPPIVRLLTLDS
jgi:hypothetical protein